MIIGSQMASAGKESAEAWLARHGFSESAVEADGTIHRVAHGCNPTGSAAGWYWVVTDPPHGVCGCWRCGLRESWLGVEGELTDEQRERIRSLAEAREKAEEEEHAAVSGKLDAFRRTLNRADDNHPYLIAKGVLAHGALIHDGALILPLQDIHGRIWSAQGISHVPRTDWGGATKSFERGGRVEGCFYPIGNVREAEKVVVCEGFATGATIHQVTELPVACAMTAGNLKAVAAAIRKNNPAAVVILAADNDRATAGNPGLTKAEEAALALSCELAIPDFGPVPPSSDASDFNDLARLCGEETVRTTIASICPPDRPPVIYDADRATWWTKNARSEFIVAGESGARRRLKANGFTSKTGKDDLISPLDAELVRLLHEDSVSYAGPVAGWPVGIHQMAGRRVLVTDSAIVCPGGAGECNTLLDLFERMLGQEQAQRFILWLVCARRRLALRRWHPLPALALVGPKNCGKSFVQYLITQLLGGRSAKPAQYLQGVTAFNGDLFGAEHLCFEDESAKCDGPSRRHLGEQIKTLLFCRQVQCHAKHRQAIALEPIWALTISLNNEPEHLMVLPSIDDSLADKILLLGCDYHPRPVPDGMEETEWLGRILQSELPAFSDMLERLRPEDFPEGIRNPRTIVAGWQNREILSMMSDLSPEAQLLSIIDDTLFDSPIPSAWTGTAEQLSKQLRSGSYAAEASRLLSWPTACGVYLARLATQKPDRIRKEERKQTNYSRPKQWTIDPPR